MNIDKKYKKIWEKASVLLKKGRPDDYKHAQEVIDSIIEYSKAKKMDLDVLIPVAMMHDIGHSAILPEDFKFIAGGDKIMNAKLVHMLAGAKIAKEILESVSYDKDKTKEIVDIIRVHDADQLQNVDINKFYDTYNKKIFHDIDSLDRFSLERLKLVVARYPKVEVLFNELQKTVDSLFFEEFKKIAEKKFGEIKKDNLFVK